MFRVAVRRWRALVLVLVLGFFGTLVLAMVLAQNHPDWLASAADSARQIVGPAPVAAVEDVFYGGLDKYNQLHYRLFGDQSGWRLATLESMPRPGQAESLPRVSGINATDTASATITDSPVVLSGVLPLAHPRPPQATRPCATDTPDGVKPAPTSSCTSSVGANAALPAGTPVTMAPGQDGLAALAPSLSNTVKLQSPGAVMQVHEELQALAPLIISPTLPGEGVWQPLVVNNQSAGEPLLWQTIYRPDPSRPFARVALVAMDLSRAQLHIVVGTKEPASNVPPNGLRSGVIPSDTQKSGTLLAAWNGGFRAVHSHYGMMTDGSVWIPPKDGMETTALDRAGNLVMGAWGRGVSPHGDWLAWRQNNPPLIENGTINPDVITFANAVRWGASINGAVFIWRSGIGLSPGRRWLFYAAGNSLSVQTLTAALQAAGVSEAMQLDVNASWERFVTFAPTPQTVQLGAQKVTLPLTAQKLIDQMAGRPTQFLVPYERDFMYLTAK